MWTCCLFRRPKIFRPKTGYGSIEGVELKNVVIDHRTTDDNEKLIEIANHCKEIIGTKTVDEFLRTSSNPNACTVFHDQLVEKRNELSREAPIHPVLLVMLIIASATILGGTTMGVGFAALIHEFPASRCDDSSSMPACVDKKNESIMSLAPICIVLWGSICCLVSISSAYTITDKGISTYHSYQNNIKTLTEAIDQFSDILEQKNQQPSGICFNLSFR